MIILTRKKNTSGQALLIVLLTMTVVLTVVLSVVSRSVTDISVTTYQEDAQRAFDAAEAGIERVLLTGINQLGSLGDAEFDAKPTFPLPDSDEVVYPSDVLAGESATFWFVSQDASGDLYCSGDCLRANRFSRICWGQPGTTLDAFTPAIELSVFYDEAAPLAVNSGDFSQVKIARLAYDPNPSIRVPSNNFIAASSCTSLLAGRDFEFATNAINLDTDLKIPCTGTVGCLLMAKVKLLYNHNSATGDPYPHPVGIEVQPAGGTNLPAQGTLIDSVGTAGDSTRRVNVFQGYPEPQFVFEAAIFGKGGLSKPL